MDWPNSNRRLINSTWTQTSERSKTDWMGTRKAPRPLIKAKWIGPLKTTKETHWSTKIHPKVPEKVKISAIRWAAAQRESKKQPKSNESAQLVTSALKSDQSSMDIAKSSDNCWCASMRPFPTSWRRATGTLSLQTQMVQARSTRSLATTTYRCKVSNR